MALIYTSKRFAQQQARQLSKMTGKKHTIRKTKKKIARYQKKGAYAYILD